MKRLHRQVFGIRARKAAAALRGVLATKSMRSVVSIAAASIAGLLIMGSTVVKSEARTQISKPAQAPKGNAENGKKIFVKDGCYECHGREAQGSLLLGPRLGPDPIPLAAMIAYVRKPSGEMPPYTEKVVSDQELADIHAFLQSLPQPPPVKSIPILK